MQRPNPETVTLSDIVSAEGLAHALISNLPGGAVFVVDRNLRYWLAEGEALAIAGFQPEDFVGRTIFEVLPPEVAASYEPMYRRVLAGEPFEHEHNAHDHWYISRGTPLRAEDREVYAVLVVSYDITDRKHSEAQLHRAAEMGAFRVKLSDALRSLADPVDIQETVTRTALHYFGADRCYYCEIEDSHAIIRRDASREDLPSVVGVYPLSRFAILQAVINAGCPFVVRDVHTTDTVGEDLRQLCIQLQVISYIDVPVIKKGKPVGVLCLVQSAPRDWTNLEVELAVETAERTWEAVERARTEVALRESELQRVREQSAREQERQRAESLTELDRAKTLFFSNISHEFRTPLTLSLVPLQDALSDRTHPLDPVQQERLELVHCNSLRLLKLVNTLLDFSRIEAGRRSAVYEPTDLATYTTELASVFRSAIEQAGLQLIVDCPPLSEPVYVDREMWEKIVLNLLSNAFKFTFEGKITVSLKTESTIERQAATPNIDNLTSDPQTLTSELDISTSQLQRPSSGLEIPTSRLETSTSKLEPLTSELDTPTSQLEALTSELEPSGSELETPAGENPATTTLHVILEICDTGTGIAPEHLPHLFERFYQVRGTQARTHEGSGIGLALVNELVRLHGGTIEVNSTVGEGTCFTIALLLGTDHLPIDRLRRGEAERPQREGAPRSGSVPDRIQPTRTLASTAMGAAAYVEEVERWVPFQTSEVFKTSEVSPRVLVVDDNSDMREYLTRILSKQVQVEAVADGTTALAVAQERVPDLILSDVMMPELDGFELLAALRADPRTRDVPIILLSARTGEDAIVEGLEAGADDYLIKPFSAQELVSRVMAHLQLAQLRGEALQQERMMNRQKDEFISVVSHELNTPLVSILGWIRLLRSSPPNSVMLSKALDTIERNAMLQAKLVQDLLDLSRITAGKLRLNPQPIDLKPVIETAIATVTQSAADKGIHLTWQDRVMEPVIVMGDGDRLSQVLINLLTNAIKFTPESGSVTLELSVMNKDGSTDASYAKIRVADTGIGIVADFLPHVFDRFRQAEGAHSVKGLGLGLAIARHILELHNGTIQAESAGEGQGATFTVTLPLLQTNDDLL